MENEDTVHIIDSEDSDLVVRSTKRPISSREQRPTCSKRQKKEMQEDMLLQKAIACMERTGNVHQQKRDEDDIFGDYIASEMRAIQNIEIKRWVKFKIQSLLFSAHSGFAPQPLQPYSQPFAPQATQSQWDYPNCSPPASQWSTQPFRTPSTTSSLNNECID